MIWFKSKTRRQNMQTIIETEWLIVVSPKHIQDKQVLESKVYGLVNFNSYISTEIFNRKMALERRQWYKKGKHMKTPSCLLFCYLVHKSFECLSTEGVQN